MGNERKIPFNFEGAPVQGLFTKFSSDTQGPGNLERCDNWDFFEEYFTTTKRRGTRPILATPYTEGSGTVHSVHFYKYLDNAGRQRRHILIGAGTTIQRVDPTAGTLTSLVAGAKDRRWVGAMFERFMIMTNQNPFLIGDGNRPLKYDGDTVSNLGVEPPGSAQDGTVQEPFDSTAGFNLTNMVMAVEPTITLDGTSIKCTPGTGSTASEFSKSYVPDFVIVDDVANRVELSIYIEQGDYEKLATSGPAIAVRFESSATDYVEYFIERGELIEGWNIVAGDFTAVPVSPNGDSGGTFNTGAVNKVTWKINTLLAADQPNIYFDKLVLLAAGTPTLSEPNVEDPKLSFDSAGGDGSTWVPGAGDTLTFSSSNATEGGLAAQLQKVQTTSVNLDLENSGGAALNMDISSTVGGKALLDVYIPTPSDLETTIGMEVWLGEDTAFGSAAVYAFSGLALSAGANTLSLDLLNPTRGIGGGVSLSDIDFFRVRFIFASAATVTGPTNLYTVDNFRVNTPTSSGGEITGVHNYRITYTTKFGLESNAGPISPDITMSTLGGDILLSNLPVSPDPQVVARTIYRTSAGGSEHLFVDRIYDNTSTTYTDVYADTALGVGTPPIAGDLLIDNYPPPDNAGFYVSWKRTVFAAGNPAAPNVLYFSTVDQAEQWPLVNAFELDERITGMFPTNRGLVITTENGWWWTIGENPDFVVDKIADEYGGSGHRAVGRIKNMGFALDKDGVRIFDQGNVRVLKISENIRDLFEDLSKTNYEHSFAINSRRYNVLLVAIPGVSGQVEDIFHYNYPSDSVVTVDGRGVAWGKVVIPSATGILPTDFTEVEDDDGEWHLYMASGDGMLYELFDPNTFVWTGAAGATTAITSVLRTHYQRPTQGLQPGLGITQADRVDLLRDDRGYLVQQGRAEIQYIELRIGGDLTKGSTWTVLVEQTEGSDTSTTVLSSKSMTFTFKPGESLKRLRPKDLAAWEHVRLTITNSDAVNVGLKGYKVWYVGQPGPFNV